MVDLITLLVVLITLVVTLKQGCKLMATLQNLKDSIASVAVGVDALEVAIKDLKAQVAAGSNVTQADLDALFAQAEAIKDDIAETGDQS